MKKFIGSLVIALMLVVGAAAVFTKPSTKNTSTNSAAATSASTYSSSTSSSTATNSSSAQGTSTRYSTADVAKHGSPSDCWIIIASNVYIVTNFLDQHRGGADQITPYCGQDATQAFEGQHGSPSRSSRPAAELEQLLIGKLS